MKFNLFLPCLMLFCVLAAAQNPEVDWYTESSSNGLIIQNSYPKGGPYPGPTQEHYNHSYLVFFNRVKNTTDTPVELTLYFSPDPFPIPDSRGTFMQLFLPEDTMTMDKQHKFSYGFTELKWFDELTRFQQIIAPKEECLFYVVGLFYNTRPNQQDLPRGGNRSELILKEEQLYYHMPPQVDSMLCGHIKFID